MFDWRVRGGSVGRVAGGWVVVSCWVELVVAMLG
jgi:hypothetical protein